MTNGNQTDAERRRRQAEPGRMTVGIGILTLNAERELPGTLAALRAEEGWDQILVVDSGSADRTCALLLDYPEVRLLSLPPSEFNHGATREMIRHQLGCDIVVFLTQDVVPEPGFLPLLVDPIRSGEAVVAYARQLPRPGAGFFEAFPREFNYPPESHVRSLKDVSGFGVYTFFCSDSCAAYANAALDEIGGFPTTLTNEDYLAVARLLQAGHRIKYVAEARVVHSHRYTLAQEFRRYFDTGYVRAENPWITALVGPAERRGARLARELFARLGRRAPHLIPYAVVQTAVKWLGFRAGFLSRGRPRWWCRLLSSQRYYWSSRHCPATAAALRGRSVGVPPPEKGHQ